jgi:hypothetical protein
MRETSRDAAPYGFPRSRGARKAIREIRKWANFGWDETMDASRLVGDLKPVLSRGSSAETPIAPYAFVSSVPYESERVHAAALYCSDGRLGDHIDEFLHRGLDLPRYDRLACPGGPVGLARRRVARGGTRGLEEQLRFLSQIHDLRKVVLVAHTDCAYYSRLLSLSPERAEEEQRADLREALQSVHRIVPGIDVAPYWARVAGSRVSFEAAD